MWIIGKPCEDNKQTTAQKNNVQVYEQSSTMANAYDGYKLTSYMINT